MAVLGLPDNGGRPRRISLSPRRNSPWRKKSLSSSGASSGSSVSGLPKYFAPAFFFFAMAVPHRNDVAAGATLSPYDHDHSAIEEAGADPANLAVILAYQSFASLLIIPFDSEFRLFGLHKVNIPWAIDRNEK